VNTIVIDKTGTLTEGRPVLTSILPVAGMDEREILRIAASVERGSEHPLAGAIVRAATDRKLPLASVSMFKAIPGKGVSGVVEGKNVLLGNLELSPIRDRVEERRREGETVMVLAVDGVIAGLIAVSDPIKDTTPEAIRSLHDEGFR